MWTLFVGWCGVPPPPSLSEGSICGLWTLWGGTSLSRRPMGGGLLVGLREFGHDPWVRREFGRDPSPNSFGVISAWLSP